ncbi:HAD hydrolase-like protein [Helicobacter trogontum]|uniref:HAD family hydrolase n=1 Tax=Helicobacter trogontum TaxID=50960 RepID=A0A4U8TEI3_9HELI|nr:HAD hydrolase-like protein [Helicobacter trogontum]TLD98456.1 hypothetical protein LS80_004755 [Helicobacter trogontum]
MRHIKRNEITFDLIYECIESDFSDLKHEEWLLELQTLQPNPEMLAVWHYVKSLGKRIAITSDIYLPKDLVIKLLHKNGFVDYDYLYVSSDIGYTKASGLLFDYIKHHLSARPSQILHIGDNYQSDIIQARQRGFRTLFYQKIMERYLNEDRRAKLLSTCFSKDLGASILLGLKALHWQKKMLGLMQENYWENIGYEYAGVIGYAYTYFIATEAKKHNIKSMLFVARDGYTLQKIFEIIKTGIPTTYIYAPRFFNLVYTLQHKEDENKACAILNFLAKKYTNIENLKQQNYNIKALEILKTNQQVIEYAAKQEFKWYAEYVRNKLQNIDIDTKNLSPDTKIGMVDTITVEFSAQKLLQQALDYLSNDKEHAPNIHANYWLYGGDAYPPNKLPTHSLFSVQQYLSNQYPQKWDFVEFLLTSPELPVKGIDSSYQPIYDDRPNKYEARRQNVYPYVANYAFLFAQDIYNIFGGKNVYFSANLMTAYLDYFYQNPTQEDIEHMDSIYHCCDNTHDNYEPLFTQQVNVKDFFRTYKKTKKRLLQTNWITKKQRAMLAIFDLFNIKIRGIKTIEFHIFPHFPPCLNISIRLMKHSTLKLSIGRFS